MLNHHFQFLRASLLSFNADVSKNAVSVADAVTYFSDGLLILKKGLY